MMPRKEIAGQRFGKLTAIEPVYVNNVLHWECKCDCGNIKIVRASKLNCGEVRSCGCIRRKDMTGIKVNKLTFKKYVRGRRRNNNGTHSYWLCECECGNTKVVRADSVIDGSIMSCGCLKRRRGKDNPLWKGGKPDGRMTSEHREWIRDVYRKDNYTCRVCGYRGGTLHAHHLFNWSKHESKRFDINNGITLCVKCHKQFHRQYGVKENHPDQMIAFILERIPLWH